ncbi:glycoside hydrolase family 3 protein [Athelia psychrophila]|uniref:beta-glucosidase n=1 Tax=Athelia psychrophila TaxID=1759441 RepID=A0A167TLY9_9AGAM|nr:glycoside hydrolase family 3 protein [Fibularhizoctonia sp. CBS 109695]
MAVCGERECGVGSVLCAFNGVNGKSCENRHWLHAVLKEELDFQGLMVSNWAAVTSLYASVMNDADVNRPGFVAYGDSNDPDLATANNSYWGARLGAAVLSGIIPKSRFETTVTCIMAAYYYRGARMRGSRRRTLTITRRTHYEGERVNEHVNVMGNRSVLIGEVGAASTVLLKNLNSTLSIDFSISQEPCDRALQRGSECGLPELVRGLQVRLGHVRDARLLFTTAKKRSDHASDILHSVSNTSYAYIPEIDYTEKLELDYKSFDAKNITPPYEFGHRCATTSPNTVLILSRPCFNHGRLMDFVPTVHALSARSPDTLTIWTRCTSSPKGTRSASISKRTTYSMAIT